VKKLIAGLFVVFAALAAGCASVPMGDPQQDAAAKTFTPPSGNRAGLYVFRNESMGAAIKMTVLLDGKLLGDTGAKTYLYTEITPGKHQLVSKTENNAVLDFDAAAGRIYYVWQEVKLGFASARSQLNMVDADKGKAGVLESKLAATSK
jgi:uncharacterized protein DUF2846